MADGDVIEKPKKQRERERERLDAWPSFLRLTLWRSLGKFPGTTTTKKKRKREEKEAEAEAEALWREESPAMRVSE